LFVWRHSPGFWVEKPGEHFLEKLQTAPNPTKRLSTA